MHLTALLLGMDDRVGGCAVSILAPGHDSAIITLTPTQIRELFWPHHGRSDGIENRRFVSLLYPFSKDQVSLDFPNVKVFVPETVACSLTNAVDAFVPRHLKALKDFEHAWGAERFQFIYNRQGEAKVLLCSVPEFVWEQMVAFSCAHDNSSSPPERFSFDSDYSGSMLKIYTSETGPTLDAGYHAIIHGRQTGGQGASVELYWQPSLRWHSHGLGPRAIWDALTTFNWLKDELLPTVLKPPTQHFRKLFKRRTVAEPTGDYLSDYRSPDLRSLLNSVGPADLTRLLHELQHIFSAATLDDPMTFAATDYISILGGIRDVAKHLHSSFLGYAASSLGLQIPNGPDLDQFVRAIDQLITSKQSHSYSCAEVDYALRALMDVLRSPEPLSPDLAQKLRHNLEPFVAKAEEIQLVWRHRRQED